MLINQLISPGRGQSRRMTGVLTEEESVVVSSRSEGRSTGSGSAPEGFLMGLEPRPSFLNQLLHWGFHTSVFPYVCVCFPYG